MSPVNDHIVHLEGGRLASDTPLDRVQAIARAAVTESGPGGIVVHFHGGLVNEAKGREIAERLLPVYRDAGAYPIFFVWEAGLLETLRNNLDEILGEKLFQRVWKRVEEFVRRKFEQGADERTVQTLPGLSDNRIRQAIDEAIASGSDAPLVETEFVAPADLNDLTEAEEAALRATLQLDPVIAEEAERISNGLRDPNEVQRELGERSATVRGSTATLMDPEALEALLEPSPTNERGLFSAAKLVVAVVKITAKVISRFVRDRDHGFHATVVEEVLRGLYIGNAGQLVWSTMKKDTADAFGDDPSSGGSALLAALKSHIDPSSPPKITLVGHSTGAVFISNWLDASAAELPPQGVVFLAPASNFDKTAATLADHGSEIAGFRMFTMTDENERKDRLVPVLYPHSLLYFVSGVVEGKADTPIVGMERFFNSTRFPGDKFATVEAVRQFVQAAADRAVWSVDLAGQAGLRTEAVKHGEFDNDGETLESVAHIIASGFGGG